MKSIDGITEAHNRKLSVCFVALNSYNLLAKRDDISHIGGAEVQQWIIAKWLLKQGFSVSFITLDHGQPAKTVHEGIHVYKTYRVDSGVPFLRFLYPRWTGLYEALARVNADIFYQRGASLETGQIALWCKWHRRPFVFAVANEGDCSSYLPLLKVRREKWLYRLGLYLSSSVVVQTKKQRELLLEHFRVSSSVINSVGGATSTNLEVKRSAKSILWVGRISPQKRFEWFLEVAERCPELQFEVVGASNFNSKYSLSLEQRASSIPNLKMHGQVPYAKMIEIYNDCKILCSTSIYEGFPNVFLEVWNLGIPTISTFDPDGVIKSNGLGAEVHDVDTLILNLRKMFRTNEIWEKASKAAKKYYLDNHTTDIVLPRFKNLLSELYQQ